MGLCERALATGAAMHPQADSWCRPLLAESESLAFAAIGLLALQSGCSQCPSMINMEHMAATGAYSTSFNWAEIPPSRRFRQSYPRAPVP